MGIAPALRGLPGHEGAGGHVHQARQGGFHERYFEVEGFPSALPMQEGGLDAVGAVEPGQHVHQGHADLHGASPGLSGDGHPAAFGLDDEVVAGPAGGGDVRGEAAHRGQDELGEFRMEALPAQAEAIRGIGLKVLDQDIGHLQQVEEVRLACLGVEVNGAAALAPVGTAEVGALTGITVLERGPPAPGGISLGGLQLLHLGAEIGQELGREGAGQHTGKIHDPEMGQGLEHAKSPAISLLGWFCFIINQVIRPLHSGYTGSSAWRI